MPHGIPLSEGAGQRKLRLAYQLGNDQSHRLRFAILGPLEVCRNGSMVPIRSVRERALLAALLLRAHHTVTVDELIDQIWGSRPPEYPKATLHTVLTRLRQRLDEPGLIQTEPGGYSIAPEQVDLLTFRAYLDAADCAAQELDLITEAACLRAGLALWRGPVLADVPSDFLQQQAAPVLTEHRLAVLQRRIAVDLALGWAAELVGELRGLTAQYPMHEGFWAHLMLALHGANRQADALASYATVRRKLLDELGVEPGHQLRHIHALILAGTPNVPDAAVAAAC